MKSGAQERLASALADRYRIEREIGSGGMATVYLAMDIRHDRHVALKVLRPELSAIVGADRFLAEIKTTANLQHPHILSLFDSGEAGGLVYYVMPFVDGESLRDRLERDRQLPVDEAVRIAREVADALEYAHQHRIVHRDIKPENILLHGGHALVADFGIALAASRSEGSTRMTETGMSLGTPNYMAPEQAMGDREITPRADVYALGVTLYEMLTGEPPFTGNTPQAIVARVLTEHPRSITTQRHTVPPHIEQAVLAALEKLPADRFATAKEFADALGGTTGSIPRTRGGTAVLPVARRRPVWVAPVMGGMLLAAGLLAGWLIAPRPAPVPPARFAIQLPEGQELGNAPSSMIAISPDGRRIAYLGRTPRGRELYRRDLDALQPVLIDGSVNALDPLFSPDGRWLAFRQDGGLKRLPVEGGTPVGVTVPSRGVAAYQWSPDGGFIVALLTGELVRVTSGGAIDTVATLDTARSELTLNPSGFLPDGRLLVTIWTSSVTTGPVDAIDLDTGERERIISTQVRGVWFAANTLYWMDLGGRLLGSPWNGNGGDITGQATALATFVRFIAGGLPDIAVAPTGAVVYIPALPADLVRYDRDGRVTVLSDEPRRFHSPRISPDGRSVAFDVTEQIRDVWLLDLRDRTRSRVSFQDDGHDPAWVRGTSSLIFATARTGGLATLRSSANGDGAVDSLFTFGSFTAHDFTPDGRLAIGTTFGVVGSTDLVSVPMAGGGGLTPILATPFNESHGVLSPDGRWLAYQSDESGVLEVYVRAFPSGGGKVLVSQGGGEEPVWSRDGRELFYFSPNTAGAGELIAAAVSTVPSFAIRGRTVLFDASRFARSTPHANYDVFPDGRSFVAVREAVLSQIVYLQNAPGLLRQAQQGNAP
jgi:Tol biopolymer transport system component